METDKLTLAEAVTELENRLAYCLRRQVSCDEQTSPVGAVHFAACVGAYQQTLSILRRVDPGEDGRLLDALEAVMLTAGRDSAQTVWQGITCCYGNTLPPSGLPVVVEGPNQVYFWGGTLRAALRELTKEADSGEADEA